MGKPITLYEKIGNVKKEKVSKNTKAIVLGIGGDILSGHVLASGFDNAFMIAFVHNLHLKNYL